MFIKGYEESHIKDGEKIDKKNEDKYGSEIEKGIIERKIWASKLENIENWCFLFML